MALVEVIQGDRTSAETIEKATALMRRWAKPRPAPKTRRALSLTGSPGPFITRRCAYLGDGDASVETIDRIMKEAGNFRMGPFELMDLIGNDVNFAATESLYRSFFEDPRFRPSPIQQRWSWRQSRAAKPAGVFTSMTKNSLAIIGEKPTGSRVARVGLKPRALRRFGFQ